MTLPAPRFEHLTALSDEVGVFEHALLRVPRIEHGYCTDDVGRALAVVVAEPGPPPTLERLALVYLAFLEQAQLPDGRFRGRRSALPSPTWVDAVGSDDANGRALYGLGVAVRSWHGEPARRALACFEAGAAGFSSFSPRANAHAVLGAAGVVAACPGHAGAWKLFETAGGRLGTVAASPGWPWPEYRLSYENARLAQARIAGGLAFERPSLLEEGVALLDWLVEVELRGDHFSFTPVGGWARGEPRPGFDQQPIEAGAMADACAAAFRVTGEPRWADHVLRAAGWFVGANDTGVELLDRATGGCCDGLERYGRNENQGAESTIALIGALQQARRLSG